MTSFVKVSHESEPIDSTPVPPNNTPEEESYAAPIPSQIIKFGKYKFQTYDILLKDRQYTAFIINSCRHLIDDDLWEFLISNKLAIKRPPITNVENVVTDSRVIPFGKYKGRTYSQIPTDYLRYLLNSSQEAKNSGKKIYTCDDTELLDYAAKRCQ